MQHTSQNLRLQTLRANLEHFQLSPDVGDGLDVQVIKRFLELRIREAESILRRNASLSEAA
jgi:hypothetical protein